MKDSKSAEPRKIQRISKHRPVPIDQMRTPPELVTQRPFRKALGDAIAANMDLDALGYPIVNWRDGVYWLLDGQHRIYALRQCGFEHDVVDCEVYENLSDAKMAAIFLGRDRRRAISPYDKFHIACTAGFTREVEIRRSVTAQGVKISRAKQDNCVSAVGALIRVYDLAGTHVLEQTTRAIRDGFAGDSNAFDGDVIKGVGMWFHRYNGQTNEKMLATKLDAVPHGVSFLIRRAEALHERTGNQRPQCVAAALVEIYNKGITTRAQRLASWWKQQNGDDGEE